MTLNISLLLLGLGSGAMIALSAFGLVLMFRSSGVLNFATGAIGMACSYVFWDLTQEQGWPTAAAAPASVLLGAVLGLISYVAVIVLPRRSSNIMRVMGTLGILVILQALVQIRYGPDPLAVDGFLPSGTVSFGGGVVIPNSRILLVIIAVLLTAALTVFYARSRFGLATTAVAENERKLAALGWRIWVVGSLNWSLGGALAGLAGILLAPITGVSLTVGTALTVTVLAAALVGGLRSFSLTLVGGMVVGMLQSLFVVRDLGVDGLADAIPFVVIVGVIIFRGRGLPLRSYVGDRLPKVGTGRISIPALAAAVVVVLFMIGPILNENGSRALTTSLLTAITLLSFIVLVGYAGQLSLAQVTLGAFSGLIAAKLTADWGWPFPLALLAGVIGVIPVGLLVGLPSARSRGASLAIVTLGLAVAIQSLVFGNESLSGGKLGIPLSPDGSFTIFGVDFGSFSNPDRFAGLVLGFVVVLGVLVANLRRGMVGRQMIAVRGNERAAAGLGINVVSTKLWAFAIASAIAGVGGVISVFRGPAALFTNISVLNNITSIGYAIIGGVGGALGALFGSLLEPAGVGNAMLGLFVDVNPVTMSAIGGFLLIFTIITSPDGIAVAAVDSMRGLHRRLQGRRTARAVVQAERWLAQGSAEEAEFSVRRATLSVEGVEVRFGPVVAVRGVELTVGPGEVVGVIGANGAGKTTLIDAVTGFVPAAGSVRLGDVELSAFSPHDRARLGVSRSWQSLEIFEDLTVIENLRVGADARRWWAPLADLVHPERAGPTPALRRAIEALGLQDSLGSTPSELSTGRCKMVALARAIAAEPSILLLDEPCSGLDQDGRDEVGRVIRMLARDMGMGVLLVEHDVHLVRRLCDRVVALDFGEVIASGPPDEVLANLTVASAFLGEVSDDDVEGWPITSPTPTSPGYDRAVERAL
jgi:ABC-type branched-subunit amino acid transport system ATPase component/branched-subunit amino acid ABC-type transport system permease component